jgi:hypothetical protein
MALEKDTEEEISVSQSAKFSQFLSKSTIIYVCFQQKKANVTGLK